MDEIVIETLDIGFNPRARGGRDCLDMGYEIMWIEFQSTRPRGARPWIGSR